MKEEAPLMFTQPMGLFPGISWTPIWLAGHALRRDNDHHGRYCQSAEESNPNRQLKASLLELELKQASLLCSALLGAEEEIPSLVVSCTHCLLWIQHRNRACNFLLSLLPPPPLLIQGASWGMLIKKCCSLLELDRLVEPNLFAD